MAEKKSETAEELQVRLGRRLEWIYPRGIQTGQKVLVHVRGMALVPYFPYHGDGWNHAGGQWVELEAKRVEDEEGTLIGLQIGAFYVPEEFLDHPRVTAMFEEKPDENPDQKRDASLAGKEQKCQEVSAS